MNPRFIIHGVKVPNPDAIKFIANGLMITEEGNWNFTSAAEAAGVSPLAEDLFTLPFISQVFIAKNFVTVTRKSGSLMDWEEVIPQLRIVIKNHLEAATPVVPAINPVAVPLNDDLSTRMREFMEDRVKPATHQDGGNIIFHSFENGVVKVKLEGACTGCPYSPRTLKAGVEVLLKNTFPEVMEVACDEVDWNQTPD